MSTRRDDKGEISIFIVMIIPVLLLLVGLVVDGSGQLNAKDQAHYCAEQAARAGAQNVNYTQLNGGTLTFDHTAATNAAQQTLAAAGMTGTVDINADRITVTATTTYSAKFLTLIGISKMNASASATVRLAQGITKENA